MRSTAIPVSRLIEIRGRALRKRVWFRVLDRAERAIIDLTILCVERVHSPKLLGIVNAIVSKLEEATKGRVRRMMDTLGRCLAQKLGQIASAWGNSSAERWAEDKGFIQYLTIVHVNTPRMFRT